WVHAVAETTAPYVFILFGKEDGGDSVHTLIFLDAAINGTLEPGDPFPYVFKAKCSGGGADDANPFALGSGSVTPPWTWLDKGGPNEIARPAHSWFYATYGSDSISPFSLPPSPIPDKQVL